MIIDKYKICRELPKRITHRGMDFTLYRIRALKDFTTVDGEQVKKDDLGGYVASESNLAQDGVCWVLPDAYVFRDAIVSDNALIKNGARVHGIAAVKGAAVLDGNVEVFGCAEIYGYARILENAQVCGDAVVGGSAKVREHAFITGEARVLDNAEVFGNAQILGDSEITGKAQVFGNAILKGSTVIDGVILTNINRDNEIANSKALDGFTESLLGVDARRYILNQAKQAVCNDRNSTYGEPENVFTNIAALWAAYLKREISPVDISNLMTLFKVARAQANPQHLDNFIDIAGYAACGADVRSIPPVKPVPMPTEENNND